MAKRSVIEALLRAGGELGSAYISKSAADRRKEEGLRARDTYLENVYSKRPVTGPVQPGESQFEVDPEKKINWQATANYLSSGDPQAEYVVKNLLAQDEREKAETRLEDREKRAEARGTEKAADLARRNFSLKNIDEYQFPDQYSETPEIGPPEKDKRLIKSGAQRKLELQYGLSDPSKPAPTTEEFSEMIPKDAKKTEKYIKPQTMLDQKTGILWEYNRETGDWDESQTGEGVFKPGKTKTAGGGKGNGDLKRWEIEKLAMKQALKRAGSPPSVYDDNAYRAWRTGISQDAAIIAGEMVQQGRSPKNTNTKRYFDNE